MKPLVSTRGISYLVVGHPYTTSILESEAFHGSDLLLMSDGGDDVTMQTLVLVLVLATS